MCCTIKDMRKYCNPQCISFAMCVIFSFMMFMISLLILFKLIVFEGSICYATGLLGSLISLWVQPPKLKPTPSSENIEV